MVHPNTIEIGIWWHIPTSIMLYFQPSKIKLIEGKSSRSWCKCNFHTTCLYRTTDTWHKRKDWISRSGIHGPSGLARTVLVPIGPNWSEILHFWSWSGLVQDFSKIVPVGFGPWIPAQGHISVSQLKKSMDLKKDSEATSFMSECFPDFNKVRFPIATFWMVSRL